MGIFLLSWLSLLSYPRIIADKLLLVYGLIMRKFYHYFIVLSLLFLSACGQKGPLYLPDEENTPVQTAETNTKTAAKSTP